MDLQEFIRTSLIQISDGIMEASLGTESSGAIINPRSVSVVNEERGNSNIYGYVEDESRLKRAVHIVEFDIAVTVVEGSETKGGIGVVAGVVGLGSQGKSEESNSSISRISFKVPVALPSSEH